MRWTLRSLMGAAGLRADVRGDADVTGLSYDPGAVAPGDLFCCISGARADGHEFAADVVRAGGAALLVERRLDLDVAQAMVPSVREAMPPLAAAFFGHPSSEMPVAAVTGTNGKTTVTYLLEAIARAAGLSPGVIGTVSRRFAGHEESGARSTPESIDLQRFLNDMRSQGVDVALMEATSDGLAQGRLRGMRFATTGFTNLTQDHLNTHGTMDAYFEAKSMLFDPSNTDRAVINAADPYGLRLIDRLRGSLDVLTYGTDDSDISSELIEIAVSGSRAVLRTPWGRLELRTTLLGRYNIDNCMCALGMARHLGIETDQILEGMSELDAVRGRLEPVDAGQRFLALVDYAHTPDALDKVLRSCRELTSGRVIVVFGCGGDRDRAKRPLMGAAAVRNADLAVITSDNPRSEDPMRIIAEIEAGAERERGDHRVIEDRREAIAAALHDAAPGDVVLIAGKGHEQGQQLADRTIPFDDREVVRELLEETRCRS